MTKMKCNAYNIIKRVGGFLALATLALAATGCGPTEKNDYTKGIATIYCDQGFKDLIQQEVEVFEYQYPGSTIRVKYTNEVEAIDSILEEKTRAAIVSRELTQPEIKTLQQRHLVVRQQCIAVDGVALIVNPKNPLNQIPMAEIGKILRGDITKWRQLGWDTQDTIKIIFDDPGSSTIKFMKEKFLAKGQNFPSNAYAQKGTEQVLEAVKADPTAIGIISVSWLGDDLSPEMKIPVEKRLPSLQKEGPVPASIFPDDIKVLKVRKDDEIEAFQPYQAYISDGRYPIVRKIYMIDTAPDNSLVHSFYVFVTSAVGQKIILYTGIVPYSERIRLVELK